MQVKINSIDYEVPFDPNVIPLGKYIEYQNQYGKALATKLDEILKLDDDEERILKIDNHLDEEAISWFSFWTQIDLSQAKNVKGIGDVLASYRTLRYLLRFNEEDCDFPLEMEWRGERWRIQDFKINPASEMSFNEVITSKAVVSQLLAVEMGKFDCLPFLAAIFFRKVDEPFTDQLIYPNSERLTLMNELSLRIAMNISLFLILCVSTYKKTFQSLEQGAAA